MYRLSLTVVYALMPPSFEKVKSFVRDSRGAIFKDKSLALLMKFFKLVEQYLVSTTEIDESTVRISEEDMEIPFVNFLTKMRCHPKSIHIALNNFFTAFVSQDNVFEMLMVKLLLCRIILYAIAETCRDSLKTKEGIDRLALYITFIGRFSNSVEALIYPIYGQRELPQAFCHRADVKGCIYVIRTPITALHLDKETGGYKGVRLASGQEIFSQKLIMDPCTTVGLESRISRKKLFGFLSQR